MISLLPLLISIQVTPARVQPAKTRLAVYESVLAEFNQALKPLPTGPANQMVRFGKLRPFLEKSLGRLVEAQKLPLGTGPKTSVDSAFDFPNDMVRVDLMRNFARLAEDQLGAGHRAQAAKTITIAQETSLELTTSGQIRFLTAARDVAILTSVVINNIERWDKPSLVSFLALRKKMTDPKRFRALIDNSIRSKSREALGLVPELIADTGGQADDEQIREMVKWVRSLPAGSRRKVLESEIATRIKKLEQVFQNLRPPEYTWPLSDAAYARAVRVVPMHEFLDLMTTQGLAGLPKAIAKSATVARLFGLYVQVQIYRLDHGKLPSVLTDAVPAADAFDTLANHPFRYSSTGNKINVWSDGHPEVGGKIELKPRNQQHPN